MFSSQSSLPGTDIICHLDGSKSRIGQNVDKGDIRVEILMTRSYLRYLFLVPVGSCIVRQGHVCFRSRI